MRRFFDPMGTDARDFDTPMALRSALLDFIADFSNWDNSTKKEYLETSRALTQSAHESLGGAPGTKPLVFDPFAGVGSIPLEALRILPKPQEKLVDFEIFYKAQEKDVGEGTMRRGSATCHAVDSQRQ